MKQRRCINPIVWVSASIISIGIVIGVVCFLFQEHKVDMEPVIDMEPVTETAFPELGLPDDYNTYNTIEHIFSGENLRHITGNLYEYDIPDSVPIVLFEPMTFHNSYRVFDEERELNLLLSVKQMETTQGGFLISRLNDKYVLNMSPYSEIKEGNNNRFVLKYNGPVYRYLSPVLPNTKNADGFHDKDIYFPEKKYSGSVFIARNETIFSFGANGYNLFSWPHLIESFRRFESEKTKKETSEFEIVLALYRFVFARKVLLNRYQFFLNDIINIISLGEGSCGTLSTFTLQMLRHFGFEGFKFGASNGSYGHNMLLLRKNDSNFIVDPYGLLIWKNLLPGDSHSNKKKLVAEVIKQYNYVELNNFSINWIKEMFDWITTGYLFYFQIQPFNQNSRISVKLLENDVFIFDGRINDNRNSSVREYLEKYDWAPEKATVLWLRPYNFVFSDSKYLHFSQVIFKKIMHPFNKQITDSFSTDSPIRYFIVPQNDLTSELKVSLNIYGETWMDFNNVDAANSWLLSNKYQMIYNVKISGNCPKFFGIMMKANPALLNLMNNHLYDYGQKFSDNLYDNYYFTPKPGFEHLTLSAKSGIFPDLMMLSSIQLDRIWLSLQTNDFTQLKKIISTSIQY
ncbi:MAG: hypothetical protein JXB48_21620 [Candidatus Latescibacteria bacterium]|nr:hypothetical protein [Candidatus Latescibacterota bacterium]